MCVDIVEYTFGTDIASHIYTFESHPLSIQEIKDAIAMLKHGAWYKVAKYPKSVLVWFNYNTRTNTFRVEFWKHIASNTVRRFARKNTLPCHLESDPFLYYLRDLIGVQISIP